MADVSSMLTETWPKLLKVFGVTEYDVASGDSGDFEIAYAQASAKVKDKMKIVPPPFKFRTDVFLNTIGRSAFNRVVGNENPVNGRMNMLEFYRVGEFGASSEFCEMRLFTRIAKAVSGSDMAMGVDPAAYLDKFVQCGEESSLALLSDKYVYSNDVIHRAGGKCTLPSTDSGTYPDDGRPDNLGEYATFDNCMAIETTRGENGSYMFNLGNTYMVPKLKLYSISTTRDYSGRSELLQRLGASSAQGLAEMFSKVNAEYKANPDNAELKERRMRLGHLRNAVNDLGYSYSLMVETGLVGVRYVAGKDAPKLQTGHEWMCILGALDLGDWLTLNESARG